MDNCIIVMEKSHRNNDSVASTSKFGSLVQINSIATDISSSMEAIESPKHEHFSIRGFVAGMRKKDWKTCLLFASEGNDDMVDNLPPLFVPRFRWWQCSNCTPNTKRKRTIEEMVMATIIDAGKDSCQNVGDKNGLFLDSTEKTGNKLHSRYHAEGEENDQSETIKKSNLCCTERHTTTTCSNGKTDVKDKGVGDLCDMPEVDPLQVIERLNNDTNASDMLCLAKKPWCVVYEPNNASSGSDGTFDALPNRLKPKLRYLADIMVEERNPTIANPGKKSASSSGMQVASTEIEAILGPRQELDVPADVAKATKGHERKRKIALGEDRGPSRVTYPKAKVKRVKGLVTDAEKSCRRVEISGYKLERDASMRLDLRLGEMTQRIKPKKTKALHVSKKMRLSIVKKGQPQ